MPKGGNHDLDSWLNNMKSSPEDDNSDQDLERELNLLCQTSPAKNNKTNKNVSKKIIDDEELNEDDEKDILAELEMLADNDIPSSEVVNVTLQTKSSENSGNTLISSRLSEYNEYLAYLKSSNQPPSTIRRYERQLNTIKEMAKVSSNGGHVEMDSLPPKPPKIPKADTPQKSEDKVADNEQAMQLLFKRNEQYKNAMDKAIAEGNHARAEQLSEVVKAFEIEIPKILEGESAFNLKTDMPPPPEEFGNLQDSSVSDIKTPIPVKTDTESNAQKKESPSKPLEPHIQLLIQRQKEYQAAALKAKEDGNNERLSELLAILNVFKVEVPRVISGEVPFDPNDMPPHPDQFGEHQPVDENLTTTLVSVESLTARMKAFKIMIDEANKTGEPSKARRYGRIIDQYKEALSALKTNQPYEFEALPQPLRCPQFGKKKAPQTGKPASDQQPSTSTSEPQSNKTLQPTAKLIALLKGRELELKKAALDHKLKNDLNKARQYAAQSISIKKMIANAEMGLPIDLKQVPPRPTMGKSEVNVSQSIFTGQKCNIPLEFEAELSQLNDEPSKISHLLLDKFDAQAQLANELYEAHTKVGNKELSQSLLSLMDTCNRSRSHVKDLKSHHRVPKYFFEYVNLPISSHNLALADDIIEVVALRCVAIPCPEKIASLEQLELYVDFEFAYPAEKPQKHSTDWQKQTKSTPSSTFPKGTAKFECNRKNRSFLRVIKNARSLKASVYYNRGLLRTPVLIGSAYVPLDDLESCATIEKTCELTQGKKAVGGAVVVMVRQRSALNEPSSSGNKFYLDKRPWLMLEIPKKVQADSKKTAMPETTLPPKSVKVLEFEYAYLSREIEKIKDGISAENLGKLNDKLKLIEENYRGLKEKLRLDPTYKETYLPQLTIAERFYKAKSLESRKAGDEKAFKMYHNKAEIVANEIKSYA